jgi:hypothetical protein
VPLAWLTLCVVWSSTWLAIKIGLRDLPPISYAAIRFVIAVIVLLAVSLGRVRLLPRRGSDYAILALTGVLMVRCQLWPSVLRRTARFIRSGGRVTGDHPDLWDAFRASDASRRTAATAETFRRTARAWRCSYDL